MLSVRNVVKRYGQVTVLDDISLDIPQGKITSLIGPNGAGKSTLLSVMSRLTPKDSGEVWIDGVEIGEWKSIKLAQKLAVLRQSNFTNLRLTVRQLVSFGRFPYSQGNLSGADQEIIDAALAYLKLEELQDRYLHQLSGGQRQRAYIAMVVAQDTEYILLDEPLNNLDMRHAVDIMKTLHNLAADLHKTVVIVLHDINFASC
jgi:iron complex transport system ATP-binding protein